MKIKLFFASLYTLTLSVVFLVPVDAQVECPPSVWHSPACGHEHGDAPPSWLEAAGYNVGFDSHAGFHGGTTLAENTAKHAAMKGFSTTLQGKDVYLRYHAASNPGDRMSRYHSYELFIKDPVGNVTHTQGWFNSGDPNNTDPNRPGRVSRTQNDPGYRPIMLVTDLASLQAGINCEQWYVTTSIEGWGPEFGLTICDSSTMYYFGENQYNKNGQLYSDAEDIYDPTNWIKLCDYGFPQGLCKGADRALELSWFGPDSSNSPNRGNPPKDKIFYATQFGQRVSGPNDPMCSDGALTNRFGVNYQNKCLPQYVASTLTSIEASKGVNRDRKLYDVTGVQVPN